MLRAVSVIGGLYVLRMVTNLFSEISDVQMPMESVAQAEKELVFCEAC